MNVGRCFSEDFFSSSSLDVFEVLSVDYSKLAIEWLFVFWSPEIGGTTMFDSLSKVSLINVFSSYCDSSCMVSRWDRAPSFGGIYCSIVFYLNNRLRFRISLVFINLINLEKHLVIRTNLCRLNYLILINIFVFPQITGVLGFWGDRKSTRLNSSHLA